MSDEASQILEMVADGKITVDEAAKPQAEEQPGQRTR